MARESESGSRAAGQTLEAPPRGNGRTDARERLQESQQRQREEFGGINWGSGFFGWLVA